MNVLVACEYSGVVRDAFRRLGHEAWSCDFEEPEGEWSNYHLYGDCRLFLDGSRGPCKWDLLIAHPTCTFLCLSSAKHLYLGTNKLNGPDPVRWENLRRGAEFFKELLHAPIPRIAVENPIMLRAARDIIEQEPAQTVQPWMFGYAETKATCWWLKNLPLLVPTKYNFNTAKALVHRAAPGPLRWKERSRTNPGMAAAMAAQWGDLG